MMLFRGFPTKAALKARVADRTKAALIAEAHFVETSIFGNELKPNGTFACCLDHPKRTKFASITVKDGLIVSVR